MHYDTVLDNAMACHYEMNKKKNLLIPLLEDAACVSFFCTSYQPRLRLPLFLTAFSRLLVSLMVQEDRSVSPWSREQLCMLSRIVKKKSTSGSKLGKLTAYYKGFRLPNLRDLL